MQRPSDGDDPVIGVSMDHGQVVIRPVGVLDAAAVDALSVLLEGARAAGQVAVVDLAAADLGPTRAQAALSTSASAGR